MDRLEKLASELMSTVPTDVIDGKVPAAIYGVGFLGHWAIPALSEVGITLSAAYDVNPARVGETVSGLPVRTADSIASDKPGFVFIGARHAVRSVRERLDLLGLASLSVDAFFAARQIAGFREFYDRLADDRSRAVLAAVLETMLTGDRWHVEPVFERDQYFALPHFCGIEKEIYVDAGAYVGDSVERFIWTHYGVFERVIAFEPGPRQFAALKTRSQRLVTEWAVDDSQIELVQAALGDFSGVACAGSQNGELTSLAVGSGSEKIRMIKLDDHLGGRRITFLKADVEGMELLLLRGAADSIRKYRPKLAICVYHYPTDILELSSYIESVAPTYQFALRHHSPQFLETVMYAWAAREEEQEVGPR